METCKCGKRALIGPRGFGSLLIEVSEVLARQFVRLGCCVDQSSSRHIRSSICPNLVGGPLMLNQPRNPRGFGVDDKPRCPNCGELTFLTRRAPAAEYALEYERQTFTCPGCERQFERVVDAKGKRRLSPLSRRGAFFDDIPTGDIGGRD